jgi:hypothetical protein
MVRLSDKRENKLIILHYTVIIYLIEVICNIEPCLAFLNIPRSGMMMTCYLTYDVSFNSNCENNNLTYFQTFDLDSYNTNRFSVTICYLVGQ